MARKPYTRSRSFFFPPSTSRDGPGPRPSRAYQSRSPRCRGLPLLLEQARSVRSRQRSMQNGDSTTGDRRARDSFDTRPGSAPVLLRSDSDESPAVSVSNLVTNAASARRSSSRCCRAYAMMTPQHRSCIISLGLGERLEERPRRPFFLLLECTPRLRCPFACTLELAQKSGRSAKRFSIKDEGCASEARS